jgi:molybdopterin/thiamine biosynthesis adenylyltransferase
MLDKRKHEFQEALEAKARLISDPAGREVKVIADVDALKVCERFGQTLAVIYREGMRLGICPYRYLRNRDSIGLDDQLKLASSTAAVIGAGGLGGHVIHLLARMGMGRLVIVDCDNFDESNLNRQLFCTSDSVGKEKAQVAAQWVEAINPVVEVVPYRIRIDESNLPGILAGADVAVDALDNIRDRLTLEKGAKALSIPLVHGALAGFDGQVMTIFPEDAGLATIYGTGEEAGRNTPSAEAVMGVPALMPNMIATFQVMEVVKILLGRGFLLRNVLLHVGLDAAELNRFPVG